MNILFDDGRCGDGKTYAAMKRIADNPGLYIIAFDRTDIMRQRANELAHLCEVEPQIVLIHDRAKHGHKTVVEAIEDIPNTYGQFKNTVVFITHASMRVARFDKRFCDWSLIIDEDFSVFTSDQWNLSANRIHFDEYFTTTKIGENHYEVTPNAEAPTINAYTHDDTMNEAVSDFRRLVELQKVYSDSDASERLSWWSVWNFRNIEHFKAVTILANAYTEKLSYKLASLTQGVTFSRIERESTRTWKSRPVTIRYFSEETGSKTYFESEEGDENLAKVAAWGRDQATASTYFSRNSYMKHDFGGREIRPLSTGRNDLQTCDRGMFIYSAQASNDEVKNLARMTANAVSRWDIKRDRELEAIAQFALRGTLRNPDAQTPFELCVFDKEQALETAAFLTRNGYVVDSDISLEFVDLGLKLRAEKTKGRPTKVLTKEEEEARKEKKREQARLRVQRHREKAKGQ